MNGCRPRRSALPAIGFRPLGAGFRQSKQGTDAMKGSSDPGVEVVTLFNGAAALLDRHVGEIMHAGVGPLVEAQRLYSEGARLQERLGKPSSSPLVVLDVGLGAGSNAAAAWRLAVAQPDAARRLQLISFERDLAAFRLAASPAHAAAFGLDGQVFDAAQGLLTAGEYACAGHTWRLICGELPATLATLPAACTDCVFWDPYSPKANPDLWNVAAFTALRRLCREGATVHTYSGATAVRSALLLAGFFVGTGEASGGKGLTTVAATTLADLKAPLDARWLARLARSSAPFPADAPDAALSVVAEVAQFA